MGLVVAAPALDVPVDGPRFDRDALRAGIVHLGLGAFARAHLVAINDAALDAAVSTAAATDWGIVGVSLRHAAVRDALAPRDNLYTLALRDAGGTALRTLGSLLAVLVAPEDPQAVLSLIAQADTRIVSLTVTEKGYCHDSATGTLRLDQPDIVHDLVDRDAPRSALGFLLRGLALRRARGLPGITLLSLDNLPANGDTLRGLLLEFARHADAELAPWIDAECSFPNSMVDRIVPRTSDTDRAAVAALLGHEDRGCVVAEPFLAWAVEDRFVAGRPDWRAGGAQFVASAVPFEAMKLRMLNGAHSAIAYLGVQAGWATVDEAMAQPTLARYVEALLRDEVAPTLAARLPGVDLDAYCAQLMQRFANPALAHRCLQIAMDGSQKLPQRWLGTLRERLAAGAPIGHLALALAAWCVHLRGHDEVGTRHAIDDPLASELVTLHARAMSHPFAQEQAAAFTRFAPVFGDLAGEPHLVAALAAALSRLLNQGVRAALESLDR